MQVIDPHVHLWDPSRVPVPWLERPTVGYSGDNALLPRRFTVRELLDGAGGIEVLKVVNIEAIVADPLAETRWLQEQADVDGYPQGIVAMVDLSRPDAGDMLAAHAQSANLRGIRQILNVHDDPRYDYVGRHYMGEPTWRRHFGLLAKHGLSFDLQVYPSQMRTAAALAAEYEAVPFVLNHAGMCVDRDVAGWREWREGLRLLAARPNVSVKISGLAMFDHHWTVESLRPYVLETIDAFGVGRCMFASNFPVDGLHASYAGVWLAWSEIAAAASAGERRALFVDNAQRIYRL
jgi:predicted TIM-barrel fold metal-dependent hydrolase